ncbi:MAG: hypothetical protein M3443_20900 [Actinomycetota bacterium]|nr:hypothetical protein [Actinomycetota bacterium]MDQ3580007.1 hypothetical protein [Actinomycetota bacterium]
MSTSEPDTLADLIQDCTEIPPSLKPDHPALPAPRAATEWTVDDACHARVNGLDEY